MAAVLSAARLATAALLCLAITESGARSGAELSRGWGESYPWEELDVAKAGAAADGTGVMVLIWKTWCGACKALRPQVAESAELAEAVSASGWHVVNTMDDEEPEGELYKPDGGYIPRVIFLDSKGRRVEGANSGNPKYGAFFSDPAHIARALRKAAESGSAREL